MNLTGTGGKFKMRGHRFDGLDGDVSGRLHRNKWFVINHPIFIF
jgi:hypothetical protein